MDKDKTKLTMYPSYAEQAKMDRQAFLDGLKGVDPQGVWACDSKDGENGSIDGVRWINDR